MPITEYMSVITKEERLRELFRTLRSVIVAYSGGVDSSYVAYVANAELGSRAVCITGQSASLPSYQNDRNRSALLRTSVLITRSLAQMNWSIRNIVRTTATVVYFCKDELYGKLESVARSRGIDHIVDGSTIDDLDDYRPGRQAAKHSTPCAAR